MCRWEVKMSKTFITWSFGFCLGVNRHAPPQTHRPLVFQPAVKGVTTVQFFCVHQLESTCIAASRSSNSSRRARIFFSSNMYLRGEYCDWNHIVDSAQCRIFLYFHTSLRHGLGDILTTATTLDLRSFNWFSNSTGPQFNAEHTLFSWSC